MIEIFLSHPAKWLLISSVLLLFTKRHEQIFSIIAICAPIITFVNFIDSESVPPLDLFGFSMTPLYYSFYSKIFGIAFIINLFACTIYALGNKHYNEIILGHLYCAGSILTVLSGDFFTLFAGIEFMMVFSSIIIFIGDHRNSKTSSMRYFIMHFIAGTSLLSGIVLLTSHIDNRLLLELTSYIQEFSLTPLPIASLIILLSFLINAGAPPFSAWVTDSYPTATTSGTTFLMAYTTKTSIYGMLLLFPGLECLIYIGLFMFCYGVVYAILESNIRRVLCFASLAQVGLMLIATGLGTNESLTGAAILAFVHIIYKSLMTISVGMIADHTGVERTSNLTKIPIELTPAQIGIIAGLLFIIAAPLTGAFIAKDLIARTLSNNYPLLYLIFIAFSPIILLTVPWHQIISAHYNIQLKSAPSKYGEIAIYTLLFALTSISLFSKPLIRFLLDEDFKYNFDPAHISDQLLLISSGIIVLYILLKKEIKRPGILLTFDYFYRKVFYPDFINYNYSQEYNYWEKIMHTKHALQQYIREHNLYYSNLSNAVVFLMLTLTLILIIVLNYV